MSVTHPFVKHAVYAFSLCLYAVLHCIFDFLSFWAVPVLEALVLIYLTV